jgi:octaprenyl-diphosphate synthase
VGSDLTDLTGLGRAWRPSEGVRSAPAEIHTLIAGRLLDVEAMFRSNLASPVAIVDELGGFVAAGGGKRVRPTLHLLCSQLCGYQGTKDITLATVLEFIHCATLIHDDIIDGATTRRGRPSTNHNWGNNVSVLFGDYLFAKAMDMALEAESLQIMERLAEVTLRMTEGEMLQTRYAGRIDLTEAEYLDLIERKTAALFGCCCELAGILDDRTGDEGRVALRTYGLKLGLAFQLVDDLLDFIGDPEALGKPAANDLREGKATLAVIDLLSTGSLRGRNSVAAIMGGEGDVGAEIAKLTVLLEESGAIDRTYQRAQAFAQDAIAQLEIFDDSPSRRALMALPEMLLHRDR